MPLNSINSLFCLPYISTLSSVLILSMTVSFSAIRSNIYFDLLLKSWECLFCCNATIKHEKELANSSHNLLFTDGNMRWQYPCAPKEKIKLHLTIIIYFISLFNVIIGLSIFKISRGFIRQCWNLLFPSVHPVFLWIV